MKVQVAILRDSPTVTVLVTRDPVCAADDADSHEKEITLPSFVDPVIFVSEVLGRYSLPKISGGHATWTCRMNGMKIALVAEQSSSPKALIDEVPFSEKNELHLRYNGQVRPEDLK